MKVFEELFELNDEITVLDLGGSLDTWELTESSPRVTMLNLSLPTETLPAHVRAVVGDGTALDFEDKSFDIVFSNSVIEHVYTWENQEKFAKEVRRVGKRYFVQTPNRMFPIEPHFLALGVQFIPRRWRGKVVRYLTPRGWITRPSNQQCEELVDEIRLLTHDEMNDLFPDATVIPEKVLGMTKSITAFR